MYPKAKLVLWIACVAVEAMLLLLALPLAGIVFFGFWVWLSMDPSAETPIGWTALHIWGFLVVVCGFIIIVLWPRKTAAHLQAT